MFETKDLDEAWDGSEPNDNVIAPLGTYYWILTYKDEALKKIIQGRHGELDEIKKSQLIV